MTWPATRLTTYAPNSQVKSADLNAIQDSLIALYVSRTRKISGFEGVVAELGGGGPSWEQQSGSGYMESISGDSLLTFGLGLNVGDRVTAVRFRWRATGTADFFTGSFMRSDGAGARTVLGSVASTTGGSLDNETKTLTVSGDDGLFAAGATGLYLAVHATTDAMRFYSLEVDYNTLP